MTTSKRMAAPIARNIGSFWPVTFIAVEGNNVGFDNWREGYEDEGEFSRGEMHCDLGIEMTFTPASVEIWNKERAQ